MTIPKELNVLDKLDSINVTKQAIRQAIVDKGIDIPEGTTFYEYAGKIAAIESGGNIKFAIQNNNQNFQLPEEAYAGAWVESSNTANVMGAEVKINDEMGNSVPFNLSSDKITSPISSQVIVSGYYLSFVMPASAVSIIDASGGSGT